MSEFKGKLSKNGRTEFMLLDFQELRLARGPRGVHAASHVVKAMPPEPVLLQMKTLTQQNTRWNRPQTAT